MKSVLASTMLLLCSGCASQQLLDALPAHPQRMTSTECPTLATITQSTNWTSGQPTEEPPAMWLQHQQFRDSLRIATPAGDERIAVHHLAVHHTASQYSIIVTRSGDNHWVADGVSRDVGVLAPVPTRSTHKIWQVSPENSAAIDRLLADPCFVAEPYRINNAANVAAGPYMRQIDIDTPHLRRSIEMIGEVQGLAGQLLNLIVADAGNGRDVTP